MKALFWLQNRHLVQHFFYTLTVAVLVHNTIQNTRANSMDYYKYAKINKVELYNGPLQNFLRRPLLYSTLQSSVSRIDF